MVNPYTCQCECPPQKCVTLKSMDFELCKCYCPLWAKWYGCIDSDEEYDNGPHGYGPPELPYEEEQFERRIHVEDDEEESFEKSEYKTEHYED